MSQQRNISNDIPGESPSCLTSPVIPGVCLLAQCVFAQRLRLSAIIDVRRVGRVRLGRCEGSQKWICAERESAIPALQQHLWKISGLLRVNFNSSGNSQAESTATSKDSHNLPWAHGLSSDKLGLQIKRVLSAKSRFLRPAVATREEATHRQGGRRAPS